MEVAVGLDLPAVSNWRQVRVYRRRHGAIPFLEQTLLPVGPEEEGWDNGGRYGGRRRERTPSKTNTHYPSGQVSSFASTLILSSVSINLRLPVISVSTARLPQSIYFVYCKGRIARLTPRFLEGSGAVCLNPRVVAVQAYMLETQLHVSPSA